MESSRSLQRIALGETVSNAAYPTIQGLGASKTMRTGELRRLRRMANGLHKEGVGQEIHLPPSYQASDKNEQFPRKNADPGKETGARNDENEPCNRARSYPPQ